MKQTSSAGRRAALLGATGVVGRSAVDLLIREYGPSEVRIVTRRPLPDQTATDRPGRRTKLVEHIVPDFDNLEKLAHENSDIFTVDDVYIAFGTTIRTAGSRERFRAIDFGYPLTFARLCAEQGASHLAIVSSLGADPKARNFYLRVKGELEEAMTALGFDTITIIRPSVIRSDRDEARPLERISEMAMRIAPLRYRSVRAADIAKALVTVRPESTDRVRVVESRELHTRS